MIRKRVVAVAIVLLLLALFLPWLSTNTLPTNYKAGVPLWNVYSLVMGGDIGYYIGGVITQDSLMTIVLVTYPLGIFLALLLLGNFDFSVAYPAGLVFVAIAAWLYDLYSQGLTLAPQSVAGPYVALAGGVLTLASVKTYGMRHHHAR